MQAINCQDMQLPPLGLAEKLTVFAPRNAANVETWLVQPSLLTRFAVGYLCLELLEKIQHVDRFLSCRLCQEEAC